MSKDPLSLRPDRDKRKKRAKQTRLPRKPDYRPQDKEENRPEQRRNKTLDEWQGIVNDRIGEAIQSGAFDDLPGKGKPQNLGRNPFEPADMEMANKLLRDNELTPAWIADRNELLAEIQALQAEISEEWSWLRDEFSATDDEDRRSLLAELWEDDLLRWKIYIDELNERIVTLNLSLPIWRMEVLQLRLDRELARIGATEKLG